MQECGFRRFEKSRKNKRIRFDEPSDATTPTEAMIEPKSEADYGDQTCQSQANGSFTSVDYDKPQQRVNYDDAGPSNMQQHTEPWLDDKQYMAVSTNSSTSSSPGTLPNNNEDARCKTKNFKNLEPCSCPLCSRTYSNVSNLRQHMRLIHNPTSVCCSLCQKSFTSDLYLKRHFLSMHGGALLPQINATQPAQVATDHSTQSHHQPTQNPSQPQTSAQTQQVSTINSFTCNFVWFNLISAAKN